MNKVNLLLLLSLFFISCEEEEPAPYVEETNTPVVVTISASATHNTAYLFGEITDYGNSTILNCGFCYSTSPNPDWSDSVIYFDNNLFLNSGDANFSFNQTLFNNISPNTTYYYKAFATNSVGTSFGNEKTFTTCYTPTYSIGQNYGGGIIFYIDCTGQHGLISSTTDLASNGIIWGCYGSMINGADSSNIGSGMQNTIDIVLGCGDVNFAAKICDNLVLNGYSDWYLPSDEELRYMFMRSPTYGLNLNTNYYWSSTEYSNNNAIVRNSDGQRWSEKKNTSEMLDQFGNPDPSKKIKVRAIRSF